MQYRLIAFDMDGTLLNSKKQISQKNMDAIKLAAADGKYIVLSTGRCIPELEEFFDIIPDVRYLICVSGAMVYDVKERKVIYSKFLQKDHIETILKESSYEDPMIHFLGEFSISETEKQTHMVDYGMGAYQEMYDRVCRPVEDIRSFYYENLLNIAKLNLYHQDEKSREQTRKYLKKTGIEIEMMDSETTSLECNAKGVTKGNGLRKLCEYLNISIDETIAVGDADNDLDILKTAGLAVAMGNANEHVKKIADVQVADNDHDGCAEAIKKILLK